MEQTLKQVVQVLEVVEVVVEVLIPQDEQAQAQVVMQEMELMHQQ